MRQSHRLVTNALSNCLGLVAGLAAGFVLPPIVIGHIGRSNYGLVVAVAAMMRFARLVQLGTPRALQRFVSQAVAREDHDELSRVLNTGGAVLGISGAIVGCLAAALSLRPDWFMAVPEGVPQCAMRTVVLLVGGLAALSLPLSLGTVAFHAKERFVSLNILQIVGVALRLGLIIAFLRFFGGSVVAYVGGDAIANLLTRLAVLFAGLYLAREASFGLRWVDFATLRSLLGYGAQVFASSLAWLLYVEADYIIIGKTMGAASVTTFSLAVTWGLFLRRVVQTATGVATPRAAKASAKKDLKALRVMLARGTKYVLLACVPIVAFLTVFRFHIMQAWLGPGHDDAARLMPPIVLAEALLAATACGAHIFVGIGKVRFFAVTNIAFGMANIVVTLFFALGRGLGLWGVALAYLFVMVIRSGILVPIYMARGIGLSAAGYFVQSYLRPVALSAVVVPACYGLSVIVPSAGWLSLSLAGVLLMVAYVPLVYVLALDGYDRDLLRSILLRAFARSASR